MVKRLLCLFSAFIVLFSASVPAYATGTLPVGFEVGLDVASLADLLVSGARIFGNSLASAFDSDVCGHAPQIGGGHKFVAQRTQVDGQVGLYYVCEYCGKTAGEVLDTTYEKYVSENIGEGVLYDNQGNISFSSASSSTWFLSDFWLTAYFNGPGNRPYVRVMKSSYPVYYETYPSGTAVWASDGVTLNVRSLVSGSSSSSNSCTFTAYLTVHIPTACVFSYNFDCLFNDSFLSSFSDSVLCSSAGDKVLTFNLGTFPKSQYQILSVKFVPGSCSFRPLDTSADYVQSLDVRVCSGSDSSGAYGYVQDGTLYQSTVRDIFNETSNIYSNPVTGDTSNVENWTYDYSDRSYTLNTEEGDTVTVTYGDSNVTINDGGTTYNVYYLTEHEDIPEHHYTSSVTLAPTCTGTGVRTYTCTDCGETYTETIPATGHSYQSAVTMPPTCTNTGVRTFTCSACGDSYTASIPATGHTWEVRQTISTAFDETGQLVREGYTLYQCSVCGEQYKITADSGGSSLPSPSSGGTSTGNTDLVEIDSSVGRGFLATIAHGLTEDLPAVLQACSQWFTEFPRFYSGFVAFLTDGVFSCYPAEYKLMMSFGIGMVTIIGIVRKILGR